MDALILIRTFVELVTYIEISVADVYKDCLKQKIEFNLFSTLGHCQ